MRTQDNGPVKSAARALDLLDEIAARGPGTQLQLANRLAVPKSSMHALLRTMIARGWIETDPTGTVYRLGIHSLIVSSAFLEADRVLASAQSYIDELASVTAETVHLGRLVDGEIVYIAKRESVHPLRLFSAVGRRLPACSTALGRAVLSQQPVELRDRHVPDPIVAMTPRTTTDRAVVLEILQKAAVDGYAVESEESTLGVRCFAVEVPFSADHCDSLGLAVPISRLDADREARMVETLLSIRARVTEARRHLSVANARE